MQTLQAIQVTYLNVTATKPRRALAKISSGAARVVVGVDAYENFEDAALAAATQLAQQLDWLRDCALVGGKFEDAMYFVLVPFVNPQALATKRETFTIMRDGQMVATDLTDIGVLAWFHKHTSQSQSWMCEHEGYAVIPQVVATADNRCAVCNVAGPEHGHYDATDSRTHKFVSK